MPPPQFSKIYFNITLTPMPESAKLSPSLTFPHQNPVGNFPLPHTCYISCPSQSLYLITQIISGKKYKASNSWLCSFIYFRTGKFVGPCENGSDICVAQIREFYRLDKKLSRVTIMWLLSYLLRCVVNVYMLEDMQH